MGEESCNEISLRTRTLYEAVNCRLSGTHERMQKVKGNPLVPCPLKTVHWISRKGSDLCASGFGCLYSLPLLLENKMKSLPGYIWGHIWVSCLLKGFYLDSQ